MRARLPLLALLLCHACGTSPTGPGTTVLEGTFDWVRSTGGLAYQEISPADAGYTVHLTFRDGTVRAFRDGTLIGTTRFTLEEDPLQLGPTPVYILTLEQPLAVFPFATFEEERTRIVAKLVVQFDDPCCDRYVHTFSRHGVR